LACASTLRRPGISAALAKYVRNKRAAMKTKLWAWGMGFLLSCGIGYRANAQAVQLEQLALDIQKLAGL
jgi:hypothetical protein